MEIVNYELYNVPPRWLFLKLETSDGTIGWGEPNIEGHIQPIKSAVQSLIDEQLLGEDPMRIEFYWQNMYRANRYRQGPILMSAIAGINQALWDIKGKYYGAPVYELLGGAARDKIRIYRWAFGDQPEEVANEAQQIIESGLTALKMFGTPKMRYIDPPAKIMRCRERLERVREVVGDDIDIGIDLHGRVSSAMADQLIDVLEEHRPMYIEEPVLPEFHEVLAPLSGRTSIPFATGERLYTRADFKPLFKNRVVDVIQPNVSHAGGISEVFNIAKMAEAHDIAVDFHSTYGPISLATSLQLDFCLHYTFLQELAMNLDPTENGEGLQFVENPSIFEQEDGYLFPPDEPGLGIEIDEEMIQEHTGSFQWNHPTWYYEDGRIAEW